MDRFWDAVVVGAGPAGSFSAALLARRGWKVLLVDRKTKLEGKACGCCLSPRALELLSHYQVEHVLEGGKPLTHVRLLVPGLEAILPLPGGLALSRRTLDNRLVQWARQAGACVCLGWQAELPPCEKDSQVVLLHRSEIKEAVFGKVVIVADGVAGRALQRIEPMRQVRYATGRVGVAACVVPPPAPAPGEIILAYSNRDYLGLVELEDGQVHLAAALSRRGRGPVGHRLEAIGSACGLLGPLRPTGPWQGTPGLACRRRVAWQRIFVVGDAAAYVEPVLGDGIACALEGATRLSQLLLQRGRWTRALPQQWQQAYKQLTRSRRYQQWTVHGLLNCPAAVPWLLRLARLWPQPIVRWIHGYHLWAPGAYL
ncbi:MAG: hypothetical protein C4297_14510 [Gemmataceae bacterium]